MKVSQHRKQYEALQIDLRKAVLQVKAFPILHKLYFIPLVLKVFPRAAELRIRLLLAPITAEPAMKHKMGSQYQQYTVAGRIRIVKVFLNDYACLWCHPNTGNPISDGFSRNFVIA